MNKKRRAINSGLMTLVTAGALNVSVEGLNRYENVSIGTKESVASTLEKGGTKHNDARAAGIFEKDNARNLHLKKIHEITKRTLNDKFKGILTKEQVDDIADGVIEDLHKDPQFIKGISMPKPAYLSILFALLYTYLYTRIIRKILKDKAPVDSFGFLGFASVNFLFTIQNGFNAGSLGYLSATIMGSITVIVNEYVLHSLKGIKRKEEIRDIFFELFTKDSPAVIYKHSNGDENRSIVQKIINLKNKLGVLPETKERTEKIIQSQYDDEYAEARKLLNQPVHFWNQGMVDLTEYTEQDVAGKTQFEVMEMLYCYDPKEFKNVIGGLTKLLVTPYGYRNRVFKMMTKTGKIKAVAWTTFKADIDGRVSIGDTHQVVIQDGLREMIRRDKVTGGLNGKAMEEDFHNLTRDLIYKEGETILDQHVSILACDFDGFKKINDVYSHDFGDILLGHFYEFVNKEKRREKVDGIYRVGGDEFFGIFHMTDKESVFNRVERIRESYSRITLKVLFREGEYKVEEIVHDSYKAALEFWEELHDSEKYEELPDESGNLHKYKVTIMPPITTSWGISDISYSELNGMNESNMLKNLKKVKHLADIALYNIKRGGKNSVMQWRPELGHEMPK